MNRPHTPPWNLDADFEADLTARGELQTVLDLVGRTSLWVDPDVAREVRVVFPKTARMRFGRDRQGQIIDGIRLWTNTPAQEAIFSAMDTSRDSFAGATVCHIYPGSPSSPQHFTRLANLIVVPRSVAAFTEWDPVLAALKRRAF